MISKEDLLKMLSLPEGSDLFAVREKVRSLEDRALDAVAAQAVMGWTDVKFERGFWDNAEGTLWGFNPEDDARGIVDSFTDSLDSAAALMPNIEEMGLKAEYVNALDRIVNSPDGIAYFIGSHGDYIDSCWAFANATARQRTEAAVLAVAGRAIQC